MNRLLNLIFLFLFLPFSGNANDFNIPIAEKDSLGDLVISNIEIVKRKKKTASIKFIIQNIGSGSVNVLGATSKKKDNLTVRAYLSGDQKLTRGDLLIDGLFLPNDFPNNGYLEPGKIYEGVMKIDLRLKTNYIAVLILKVDDLSTFLEEDETNNYLPLILN